ncbi:MAG: hypothetical protein Q8R01_03840 [Ramlibacter sp.]|nr:hypothetical protein [Ramlibacter sp.]
MNAGSTPEPSQVDFAFDSDTDAIQFFEDSLLAIESNEMLAEMFGKRPRTVTYGDGTHEAKVRRVLRIGAAQILRGAAPPEFLTLMAGAILKRLNGDEKSLDAALGLSKQRGGQRKDPASNDHVVWAYAEVITQREPEDFESRQRDALQAAYLAHHGTGQQELKHARGPGGRKSAMDLMTDTKRLLTERGYY